MLFVGLSIHLVFKVEIRADQNTGPRSHGRERETRQQTRAKVTSDSVQTDDGKPDEIGIVRGSSWLNLVLEKLAALDDRTRNLLRLHNLKDPRAVLAFFQELKIAVPDSIRFYLVASQADDIAQELVKAEFSAIWQNLSDIESELPFDSQTDALVEAREVYFEKHDYLIQRVLTEVGEYRMAEILKYDSEQFDNLSREGEKVLGIAEEIGLAPPEWLEMFAGVISDCISGFEGFGGIDAACTRLITLTQILAGPARVEFVGENLDGQVAWAAYRVDLAKLLSRFRVVHFARWQSGAENAPLAHGGIQVFGNYFDQTVTLTFSCDPIVQCYDPDRCMVLGIDKHSG